MPLTDQEIKDLKARYMTNLPEIQAVWDISTEAANHNDPDYQKKSCEYILYRADFIEVWDLIYKNDAWEVDTLWREEEPPCHDPAKIVRVIHCWENGLALSPLIFLLHQEQLRPLDGNHRLTVARAIDAKEICFYIAVKDSDWVSRKILSAIEILRLPASEVTPPTERQLPLPDLRTLGN